MPFKCNTCDQRFRRKFVLVQHELTHVNSKDFQCEHCDKAFLQRSNYTRHLRTAHREPHKCRRCKDRFATTDELGAHMLQVHGTHLSNARKKVRRKASVRASESARSSKHKSPISNQQLLSTNASSSFMSPQGIPAPPLPTDYALALSASIDDSKDHHNINMASDNDFPLGACPPFDNSENVEHYPSATSSALSGAHSASIFPQMTRYISTLPTAVYSLSNIPEGMVSTSELNLDSYSTPDHTGVSAHEFADLNLQDKSNESFPTATANSFSHTNPEANGHINNLQRHRGSSGNTSMKFGELNRLPSREMSNASSNDGGIFTNLHRSSSRDLRDVLSRDLSNLSSVSNCNDRDDAEPLKHPHAGPLLDESGNMSESGMSRNSFSAGYRRFSFSQVRTWSNVLTTIIIVRVVLVPSLLRPLFLFFGSSLHY